MYLRLRKAVLDLEFVHGGKFVLAFLFLTRTSNFMASQSKPLLVPQEFPNGATKTTFFCQDREKHVLAHPLMQKLGELLKKDNKIIKINIFKKI